MRPKFYLFGDSITEESFGDGGWGASLANHFSRTVDVVLRGYSGYNTRWALKVIENVFPAANGCGDSSSESPLAVTVFFGANDACLPDRSSAFQHVPLDEYKRNLYSIVLFLKLVGIVLLAEGLRTRHMSIENFKRWPTTRIILITPPPIDEEGRLRHPYVENLTNEPERTNEAAGAYAKACVSVAGECGISVIDLWTKIHHFPHWKKSCLRDGLHLTPSGNRIVFDEVVRKLMEEGLSLDTLRIDLPLISEIDPNDPLKSFEH